MARGRKPDPVRQRTDTGHRPLPEPVQAQPLEPKLDSRKLRAPAKLSKGARKIWKEATKELAGRGMLGESDLHLLFIYCELADQALQLTKKLSEVEDPSSAKAKKIRVSLIQMIDKITTLAALFGIGPRNRVALGLSSLQGISLHAHLKNSLKGGQGAGDSR